MVDIDPRYELVDDSILVQTLLERDIPLEAVRRGYDFADRITITTELDPNSAANLPVVMYELEGDDDYLGNGPGLWFTRLVVTIFTEDYDQNWELAKVVHAVVAQWDIPGKGYLPEQGGFERVDTAVKFTRAYVRDMFGKTVEQSEAIYYTTIRTI